MDHPRSRIESLPTLVVLGVSFVVWGIGFFIISPVSDAGYLAFQRWEMVSPTLISLGLYLRALRREQPRAQKVGAHVAWMATAAVVLFMGRQVWFAYDAMDDAPRGLLWDAYQFAALVFGAMTYWICTAVAWRFTQR